MCNLIVWFVVHDGDGPDTYQFFTNMDDDTERARELARWYRGHGDTFTPLESHGDLAAYLCDAPVPVGEAEDEAFLKVVDAYTRAHVHGESSNFIDWPMPIRDAFTLDGLPLTREHLMRLVANVDTSRVRMEGRKDARIEVIDSIRNFLEDMAEGNTYESIMEGEYDRGYEDGLEVGGDSVADDMRGSIQRAISILDEL